MELETSETNLEKDSSSSSPDPQNSIRRRPIAISNNIPDSSSMTSKLETAADDDNNNISGIDSSSVDTSCSENVKQTDDDRRDKESEKENGRSGKSNNNTLKYAYRASVPAHRRVKESPLSSDAIFRQSHAGLFNLCIVVLVAVNSRLIIENIMKYGLLIRAGFWFSSKSLRDWPLFMCCASLPIFPLGAFVVEKLAKHKYISEPVVVSFHVIITTASILYPVNMILRFDSAVQSGIILMLFASIVWLKLVSYAHTNYDMRDLSKPVVKASVFSSLYGVRDVRISRDVNFLKEDVPDVDYSFDVSFNSLVYFMVAPTLCYQTSYPRTACIRKGWVTRQLIKLVIFTGFMGFIIEQYINPIVQNSQHPLKGNLLNAIERVLKLSVPTIYVWFCMFYCFFHLWLNILAELLCFGDREFYKDWWNAKTVEEVGLFENLSCHGCDLSFPQLIWFANLLFFPLYWASTSIGECGICLFTNGLFAIYTFHAYEMEYQRGKKKCIMMQRVDVGGVSGLIAFFLSAVFHELCVAVPCHIFKLWAFIGIMLQVPLVILTNYLYDKFRNAMVGNMIFWFIFCILGQPMSILLYYHDLMNRKARS
ncbi:hypothetical protein IFM89_002211 [Coptis chinensis]|uniref:O-acyltransferase n=1 Tax=Coptis chinensis TaxID=261450 RepID=A0A835I6R6_9MAGN|nr:hypothetical protein IFM89_002211 [Coptis chinensis]